MRADVFEQAPDVRALAARTLEALRAYGARPALNRHAGDAVADLVDGLVRDLRRHDVRPGELLALAGGDPVRQLAGVLAAWLAGATPCTGPAGAALRLRLDADGVRAGGGAAQCLAAALVVVEPLVGAVAHPLATLGRLPLPAESAAALVIVADWRVDAWLPLALRALRDGIADIALLPDAPDAAVPAGVPLAAPLAWIAGQPAEGQPALGTAGLLTWGGGSPAAADDGRRHLHAAGDHFVIGTGRAGAQRTHVFGRHQVCNGAGRVLPDNAWGVLALAGTLPVVADALGALAAPAERTWLTGYRARRRADGSVEFDDAGLSGRRHAGRCLSAALVDRLLAECGLGDAALVASDAPPRRLVLYATDDAGVGRLAAALPDWAAPLGVALLPRLPRDAAGVIDAAALRAAAPPDSGLLAHAARTLDAAAGGEVQLRTRAVPLARPPLPLPPGFTNEGGRYPADAASVLTGPALETPTANLIDRLQSAAATGRGLVLVDGSGRERTLSYARLLDAAARVAAGLRAQGVTAGAEVIVHCARPEDLFAGIWGCILLGVLPVPLTPASQYDAPANPLWYLLGPDTMLTRRIVLTSRDQQPATAAALAQRGLEATLHLVETALDSAPLREAEWTPGPDALMLLTSGSTGAPKGVVLPHRSLVSLSLAVSRAFGFDSVETSLNWLAIDHVGGLVQHHMRDLCLGNQQLHVDTAYVLADPTRMLDLIDRHRVSLLWMANFGFNLMNEHAERIAAGSWDLASVKLWENGGEAVTHDGCQRFLALLAPHGLRGDVIKPVFGMTETTSACIGAHNLRRGHQDNVHWLSDTALDSPVRRALPGEGNPFVEVGQPFPGTAVRVVDAQGRVCPTGVAGRIEAYGLQLMSRYYRNDKANAETFTPDGWLRMGDCGFMAGGSLVVTGREKEIVIVNGLNYSAHALENTVEGVAGVRTGCCAAVAVRAPDGVTDSLVVFYSSGEGRADPAAIAAALIAEHGLRPAALVALDVDAWPRTAIGKIRRQHLASGFVAGAFADRITLHGDGQLGERTVIPDWHFALDWTPAAAPAAVPRRVLWLGGGAPAGAALAAEPGGAFAGFDAAGRASYRMGEPADLAALVAAADARLDGLQAVVDAHWHAAPAADGPQAAGAVLAAAHAQWDALCTAVDQLPDAPGIVLATSAAFALDGTESGVAHAALPGVAASLAQSRPRLRVTLVDGAGVDAVLAECGGAGGGRVAYRGGVRLAPTLRPLAPAQVPSAPSRILRAGGHYLVIGGLGGVGAHLCLHLLRRFKARLLIVGRSRADEAGQRAQVLSYLAAQAAEHGADVRYRQLDAADAQALRAALQEAMRDWDGPLDAAFNLAGEGSVAERLAALDAGDGADVAQRRAVHRMALAHALDEALPEHATPVVTFSSVNGWFGGTGFVEYAGACAYQAAFAVHRTLSGRRPHLCLDWSMWKQVGMAAEVPASMVLLARRRGFDSLTPAQGLASLHVALDSGAPRQLIGLYAGADAVLRLLPPVAVSYEVESIGAADGADVAAALGIAPERVRLTRSARPATVAVPAGQTAALLAVFRDVLVRPDLAEDDNFFANGGDSIRAIQAVSRAADLGLKFSPLDLFEHKSVGALAQHLARHGGADDAAADDGADDGQPVALPPIFGWWLEAAERREVRDHFTMGMRYGIDAALTPARVQDALLALIARHDALRLCLRGQPGAWQLEATSDPAGSLKFASHRCGARDAAAAQVDAIERDLHRRLDLQGGVLVGAAHVAFADGGPALLLVLVHHAAIDGVSWRILEDELRTLLDARGGPVPAPPSLGFCDWARRLARRARRLDGAALADAWAAGLAQPAARLPGVDGQALSEAGTTIRSRTVPIDALRLLGDASVYEVLLTAVGWSLAAWMGGEAVVLDVEGHGRLSRDMPEDLGRTIGWFTSIAPLRLDFSGCRDASEGLARARAAAAELRGRDLEWGMLQYMDVCPPAHPLRAVPPRQVSFNYLGSFDSADQPDASLKAVPGSLSAEQSPHAPRRYAIDIAAQVTDWNLELSVKYSRELHADAVIERWLDGYEDVLRQLLSRPSHPSLGADDMLLALGEVEFDTEEA